PESRTTRDELAWAWLRGQLGAARARAPRCALVERPIDFAVTRAQYAAALRARHGAFGAPLDDARAAYTEARRVLARHFDDAPRGAGAGAGIEARALAARMRALATRPLSDDAIERALSHESARGARILVVPRAPAAATTAAATTT